MNHVSAAEPAIDSSLNFYPIQIDLSRDDLLTDFSKSTMKERYLSSGESFQDRFANVARYFADDTGHAQRMYDYISRHWVMPATPVLSNGGTDRGLAASCFLNSAVDSLRGIRNLWDENIFLGAFGGGIGCVDADTEYLTPQGWVRIADYKSGEIMVISEDGNGAHFEYPVGHIAGGCSKPLTQFTGPNGLDMVLSDDHRNYVLEVGTKNPKIVVTSYLKTKVVEDFGFTGNGFGVQERKGLPFNDDLLQLIAAVSASTSSIVDGERVIYSYTVDRMLYLRNLMTKCRVPFKTNQTTEGVTTVTVQPGDLKVLPMTLEAWSDATQDQIKIIYAEMNRAGLKASAEVAVQALIDYCVMLTHSRSWAYPEATQTFIPEDGKQYCFRTSTGLWLARRNGFVFVTGNSYWGDVRSIGEAVGRVGKTSGVVPFIRVMDAVTSAISQGSIRRGAGAVYLPVWHPEIEEFIEIRKPTGGDPRRKVGDLHHGVCIPDSFYHAVEANGDWDLISPKTGKVLRTIRARDLWIRILTARMEQGEPYIINLDHVNAAIPEHHKLSGLNVKQSNLCVAPETRILTQSGYVSIKSVSDQFVTVWNGSAWSRAYVRQTHDRTPLLRVTTSTGSVLDVTPYHRWRLVDGTIRETQHLNHGDVLMSKKTPNISNYPVEVVMDGAQQMLPDVHAKQQFLYRFMQLPTEPATVTTMVPYLGCRQRDILLVLSTLGVTPMRSTDKFVVFKPGDLNMILQFMTTHQVYAVGQDPISIVSVEDVGRSDATYCFNESIMHQGVFEDVLTMNCTEITLPTGLDHHGKMRTAVCFLTQLNLEYWDDWSRDPQFIEDVYRFIDNVVSDFINKAPPEMKNAAYSAWRERSVAVGAMGFHSFLQSKNVPFESAIAKSWNKRIFRHIREGAERASRLLAEERGACPDAAEHGIMERFSNKTAIAPTASVSIIAGGASPGVEPIAANVYMHKTLDGSFKVKNKYLERLLNQKGMNTEEVWHDVMINDGSVQHLDFLDDHEKDVFKTAFELDQRWIIEHAADRQPDIDQAQSINVFLKPDIFKRDLHQIHYLAWRKRLKSLYYCRSQSVAKSSVMGLSAEKPKRIDYDECIACQ